LHTGECKSAGDDIGANQVLGQLFMPEIVERQAAQII
jgi:hypothetical protein